MPQINEEIHSIRDDLQTINTNIATLGQKYSTLAEDVNTLTKILTGNGSPERGLVIRVDRLERETRKHPAPRMNRWVERAALAVLLPALTAGAERLLNVQPDKPQPVQHTEAVK